MTCVALIAAVPHDAAAQETTYEVSRVEAPEPKPDTSWGERSAAAGDLDGDGVSEIFVGVPQEEVGSAEDAGRVYLLSGKTRTVIYRLESPQIQDGALFGFFISVLGDVNADGKDDLAVGADAHDVYTGSGTPCGAPEPNGCNEDQGRAWVFSGTSGTLLYQLDNPSPQPNPTGRERARFGSRIGRAGDLTGDGRSELIVGASHNDQPAGCGTADPVPPGCRRDEGQAFIFDGSANGPAVRSAPLRTLNMPDPATEPAGSCTSGCGSFGLTVQGPGDVDGDGVDDQLVDAASWNRSQGRMYLFSGDEDGKLLARIESPVPQNAASFGFQDAAPLSPGDVNGDGHADLYGNGFSQFGPTGPGEGRAWVFSGRATVAAGTGVPLYEIRDPTPEFGGQFGWSMNKTDYNRDGNPDLYVGQAPHHMSDPERNNQKGGTYVFDGRNGSELKRLELPESDVRAGDWVGGGGSNGPALGWSSTAPGDLNGDGKPDYVAGAPYLDVRAFGDNQGRLYAFLSGPTQPPPPPQPPPPARPPALAAGPCANHRRGTNRGERIRGTVGGDRILGLRGNDGIDGLAGDDCLDGGSGADRLIGSAGNDVLSGGSGNDRLTGGSGTNRYSAGKGNDRVSAANRRRERIDCGSGRRDKARVDRNDRVRRCERVVRSRRR